MLTDSVGDDRDVVVDERPPGGGRGDATASGGAPGSSARGFMVAALLLALTIPAGTVLGGTDPSAGSAVSSDAPLPTPVLIDLNPEGASTPFILGDADGAVVFGATAPGGTYLHRTDGTPEGTTRISESRLFQCLDSDGYCDYWSPEAVVVGETVVLPSGSLRELWATDGTAEGTVLLRKGWVGALTGSGDQAFFIGGDKEHGFELWRTDGTVEGTRLVRDIGPGKQDGVCVQTGGDWCLDQRVQLGTSRGGVLFGADDGSHGVEPWVSDGTRRGTRRLADIRPGTASGGCSGSDSYDCGDAAFIGVVDHAYFWAADARHGTELWITDGSVEGTRLVVDLLPGPRGSDPDPWTAGVQERPGRLYFSAWDERGRALWVAERGKRVRRLEDLGGLGTPSGFTEVGRYVYFTLGSRAHRDELWRTDGTAEGTVQVVGGSAEERGRPIGPMAELDGSLYFVTHDRSAEEATIWRTDGTNEGTVAVARMPSSRHEDEFCSISCGIGPQDLLASDGRLLFTNDDGETGRELWVYTPAADSAPLASPAASAASPTPPPGHRGPRLR